MNIKSKNNLPFIWSIVTCLLLLVVLLVLNNNRPETGEFKRYEETFDNKHKKSDYSEVEKITLEISKKDYTSLDTKRNEAVDLKVLLTSDEDYIKAKIHYKEKKSKAEIRLKGDWADHLIGEQWSFRVKMKSDNAIMGMKKFSLHRPITRNYAGEWLFHQLLADADILNLQYHFVELELIINDKNGRQIKNLGLYALEEAFDKHLLERNQRREGAIIKLNENPLWEERAEFLAADLTLDDLRLHRIAKEENLTIEPFNSKKILADSSFLKQFKAGRTLFKSYLLAESKISEVFDLKKLAKYNAICNLLGANHALIPHNLRVYYNAQTARLEPVGFDANALEQHDYLNTFLYGDRDLKFIEAYVAALIEVTSKEYIDNIHNYPGFAEIVQIMQKEYPSYKYDKGIVNTNAMVLKRIYQPNRCINAYYEGLENGYLQLTIDNYGRFPVEIKGIKKYKGRVFTDLVEPIIANKGKTRISIPLRAGFQQIFTDIKKKKVGFNAKEDIPDALIEYNVYGSPKIREVELQPWEEKYAMETTFPKLRENGNLEEYDFLKIDEEKKEIRITKGNYFIKGQIIVPAGYTFIVDAGSRINLGSWSSGIISYSPVHFAGTAEEPIDFYSETERGHGIAVLNAQDTSLVENCKFRKLANPRKWSWFMSGSVNFYESPVKMRHCAITENRCEDALNVIRSWMELDDIVFSKTQSDAFDGDYVRGTIKNSLFGNLGNDAIDVSGSDIYIENVTIYQAGDKGLSAGENSKMQAKNVLVKGSEIAVAAKDKSFLGLEDCQLENNKLNFTAFQKKPEFGPADILAKNVKTSGFETDYLIETGSSLMLNGKKAATVSTVKDRMYGVEFGKSSR